MSASVLVRDEWLDAASLRAVREFLRSCRYFSALAGGGRGPEGTLAELDVPLKAAELRLLSGAFVADGEAAILGPRIAYPSGTALDAVLDKVRASLPELEEVLGRPGTDWQILGAGPKHYPRGHGLSPHDDARFVGTFAFYVHEEWDPAWGGDLRVEGPEPQSIFPTPNRCVFIRSGVRHEVLPVAQAAGARLRMSVVGYTLKKGASSAASPAPH